MKITILLIGGKSDGKLVEIDSHHNVIQVRDKMPGEDQPRIPGHSFSHEPITATTYRVERIIVEKTEVLYGVPSSRGPVDALWLWEQLMEGYRRPAK